MEKEGIKLKLNSFFNRNKWIKLILELILLFGILFSYIYISFKPKNVEVVIKTFDSEESFNYSTIRKRIDTFFEDENIDFDIAIDKLINRNSYDSIRNNMKIVISKPYEIYLTIDKETKKILTQEITVSELLNKEGIVLGTYDTISKSEGIINPNEEIVISRIKAEYIKEEKEIPFKKIYIEDKNVAIGNVVINKEGKNGIKEDTYYVITKDGEELSKTLVKEDILEEPINMELNWGTKKRKGVPENLEYVKKITNVKATSYYTGGKALGSYGLYCTFGTCAVDPKVIPLGSILYITGYGYAIANDTGTAIKGNRVDLYMEYRSQMFKWGAHKVTVYILEYGDNSNAWNKPKKKYSIKLWQDGVLRQNLDVNYFTKYIM